MLRHQRHLRTVVFTREMAQMRGEGLQHETVLIIEDVAITAMAVADALADAGYVPLGPCTTGSHALALLEQVRPDYAILDITLTDGSSLRVARELRWQGVPFLVYSGWAPFDPMPEELEGAPWLEKPIAYEALVRTLVALRQKSALLP